MFVVKTFPLTNGHKRQNMLVYGHFFTKICFIDLLLAKLNGYADIFEMLNVFSFSTGVSACLSNIFVDSAISFHYK